MECKCINWYAVEEDLTASDKADAAEIPVGTG